MARLVSLSILSTLIVVLGLTFFRVLAPFLLPLFLAGVTTLLVQPIFLRLIARLQGRVQIAAGVLSAGVMLAILLPVTIGILLAILELYTIANTVTDEQFIEKASRSIQGRTNQLDDVINRGVAFVNGYLPSDKQADAIAIRRLVRAKLRESLTGLGDRSLGSLGQTFSITVSKTFDLVGQLLSTTIAVMIGLTIYVIALYYFLSDGRDLLAAAESLIPIHIDYQREILNEFAKAVRSVVMATFLAALAQGIATTFALQVLGFGHFFSILILATVFSLIPLAGAWLVWGPVAISLFLSGNWGQGMMLTLYGAVIIGMLDNVVRAYVLNSDTKLHPLLALVSVLGGIQTMGLWGVFIGPIVASCLYALMRIFNSELFALSREKLGLEMNSGASPMAEAAIPSMDSTSCPAVPVNTQKPHSMAMLPTSPAVPTESSKPAPQTAETTTLNTSPEPNT